MPSIILDDTTEDADWIKLVYPEKGEVQKHTPGGVEHDQSRHAGSRGTSTGRVWTGEQQPKAEKLTKLKTGEIGEQVAMQALEDKLGAEFKTVNVGVNNAPIDVIGDHTAVEVKAGLASNGKSAQQWRATIGQPGVAERAALKQMTPDEKRAHNKRKQAAILERKKEMVNEFSEKMGTPVKPATVGVILSPDGTKADVFMVPGFHLNLQWRSHATDDNYLGTYEVEQ